MQYHDRRRHDLWNNEYVLCKIFFGRIYNTGNYAAFYCDIVFQGKVLAAMSAELYILGESDVYSACGSLYNLPQCRRKY